MNKRNMKILVLANKYYPIMNANELCIKNIIDCLPNVEWSVICFGEKENIIRQDDIQIYSIKEYSNRKISNKYLKFFFELPSRLMSLINMPIISLKKVNLYVNKVEDIIKKDKPDVVISLLNPIESVEAGYIVKKHYPKIKFVIYDIDTISNCSLGIIERLFKKSYLKTVKKWEYKVFSAADLIIHFKWHKKHFQEDFYKGFLYKTLFLGIPVLKLNKYYKRIDNKDFIYAGRFYRNLREPKVLTDIFAKVFEKFDNYFHIYTNDEYVKIIKNSNNIIVHRFIEQNKLDLIIDATGYLVSLGNKYSDMFPSKIVSYVGKLKPIIHIYQNPKDPVIGFLSNYPNALLLDEKDAIQKNVEKIIGFVNANKNIPNLDLIIKNYADCIPSFNAKQIYQRLTDL